MANWIRPANAPSGMSEDSLPEFYRNLQKHLALQGSGNSSTSYTIGANPSGVGSNFLNSGIRDGSTPRRTSSDRAQDRLDRERSRLEREKIRQERNNLRSGGDASGSTRNANYADIGNYYRNQILNLAAQSRAQRDASRDAVTSRMNAEARRQADDYARRLNSGLYSGDGYGRNRTVSVNSNPDALRELENANYYKNQIQNIKTMWDNALRNPAGYRVSTMLG